MDLIEYFEDKKGRGILSTADADGKVDSAVFAIPHIMDKDTIALIMPDRLTHHNLQSNDHAAYLFMEDGPGYKGLRLFLKKIREEKDTELLHSIRRKKYSSQKGDKEEPRFLVFFKVDKVLPLVGSGSSR
ncbi:MAG: pyridoxamine 5'-phosphate oxidase family protein [Deltaproteobacteria bacterium]|nr:pyridoxamine 5'-phosphate oxidase family protein [Deltaproteobacteria bacterium]